jgi:hypothetical protein
MGDNEHTPTTDVIRWRASHDAARFGFLQELSFEAQFDRWLAAHDERIRASVAAEIEALAVAMRNGDGWDEEWSTREVRDAVQYAASIARGVS